MKTGRPKSGLASRSAVVGAGVVSNGIGTLGMMAVAANSLSVANFATFATWWIVATLVIFPLGLFEALLARRIISDLASNVHPALTVGRVGGRTWMFALAVSAVVSVSDPLLRDRLFDGHGGLGPALGVYCVLASMQAIQRGYSTGTARFGVVSMQLAIDGLMRAVLVAVAVVMWPDQVVAAALAACVAVASSVAVTHPMVRGWLTRPILRDPQLPLRPVLIMLIGAVGPVLINNAALPWLTNTGADPAIVGAFAGALTLSRIPVQLAGSAFGPLVNQIGTALDENHIGDFRSLHRRMIAASGCIGVAFALGFTMLGSPFLARFLGSAYHLPWWSFLMLGATSGLMMLAMVVQAAAVGHQRWMGLSKSWLLGGCAFVVTLVFPLTPLQRASLAPLVAVAVSVIAIATVSRASAKSG